MGLGSRRGAIVCAVTFESIVRAILHECQVRLCVVCVETNSASVASCVHGFCRSMQVLFASACRVCLHAVPRARARSLSPCSVVAPAPRQKVRLGPLRAVVHWLPVRAHGGHARAFE